MTRLLFLAHRYLGIVVCVLMLGWCLSGFVMLYESYPQLPEARRTAALAPLAAAGCCAPAAQALTLESRLLGGTDSPRLMTRGDSYYFGHHSDPVTLPVYRLVLPDPDRTRYYLDPVSGEILRKVDAGERGYRWLHQGLHRLDFSAALRARPLWDVLMILLLGGATMICATGLYSAVLRLCGRRGRRRQGALKLSNQPLRPSSPCSR